MAEHPVPPPADQAPPVDAAQRSRVARGTRIAVIVVLVLLAVGAGRTIVGRMANAKILEANVSEGAVQYVRTTVARTSEGGQPLARPGALQGFQQAPRAAPAGSLAAIRARRASGRPRWCARPSS